MMKSLPTEPMTDPASGGARIGELIQVEKDFGPDDDVAAERTDRRNSKGGFYFAASCAHFVSVVKKGFASAGGSTSPVSAALNDTMCP